MVVVSISKTRHLCPARKKQGGGAWGLEEPEERQVSICILEVRGSRLLCCGAGAGAGTGAGTGAGRSAVAKVTGTMAKATAGRQCRHLCHGKLFSIPPPPSAMSARTGGTLRPLLGWSIPR